MITMEAVDLPQLSSSFALNEQVTPRPPTPSLPNEE